MLKSVEVKYLYTKQICPNIWWSDLTICPINELLLWMKKWLQNVRRQKTKVAYQKRRWRRNMQDQGILSGNRRSYQEDILATGFSGEMIISTKATVWQEIFNFQHLQIALFSNICTFLGMFSLKVRKGNYKYPNIPEVIYKFITFRTIHWFDNFFSPCTTTTGHGYPTRLFKLKGGWKASVTGQFKFWHRSNYLKESSFS